MINFKSFLKEFTTNKLKTAQNDDEKVYAKKKDGTIVGPYDSKSAAYMAVKDAAWIKQAKQLSQSEKQEIEKQAAERK
jgi:hypothetical protein